MKKFFFTSTKYENSKISLGFFTRQGSYSIKNFHTLNRNNNNNNIDTALKKNIIKAQKKLYLDKKRIKFVEQIHSNKSVIINKKNYINKFKADAIITQDKSICIAILTADCCPIFLFDDENKFISCLHSGWKGVYSNLIKNTINNIIQIQPNMKKINAIIGPCLGKKNFEVSEDFKMNFIKTNFHYQKFFSKTKKNKKSLFDMRSLIKYQLISNKIENIDDIIMDTYDNSNFFFSHRRSTHLNQLPTGRMINIIGFKE